MGFYDAYVLPHIIEFACGSSDITKQRSKVVAAATSRVLEVGMGPGLNLAFHDRAKVEMVWGLEPDGQLLFSEHGEAPDGAVRRWQHRIDPVWTRLAGGCHITRPIPQLIESAGFGFVQVDSAYLPGPKISSYHSWGAATPR